ncbi:hypothetical protein B0H19DRAFT_964697, partial [Mycena capillaripes]
IAIILALIDHTPDIYLDKIQEQLYIQHDLDVSLATVLRTTEQLGLSSKKLLRQAAEHCAHARWDFIMKIGDEPAQLIWLE